MKVLKENESNIKVCRCRKGERTITPRIYGNDGNGRAVIINYDVTCSRCGAILNIDVA